ncbi:MAG: hypothetical protein CMJ46_13710 [Planctomyces sp.]|nr:hypothetical protein [Planctomyces sp.]
MTSLSPHEAAIQLAELGYRVFPVVPGKKVPLTQNGFKAATTDPGQIDAWWEQQPRANIGVPTGTLFVLDVDAGATWLDGEPDRLLELACAPMTLTAGGGRHYFFRQPEGHPWRSTAGQLAEKVDTRGEGGYVVVPPSILSGDRCYQWSPGQELNVPVAQLPLPPDWLTAELDRLSQPSPFALSTVGPLSAPGGATAAVGRIIPEGQRDRALARLAGVMRRGGMEEPEIAAGIHVVNRRRCKPPLPEKVVDKIANSIARYAPDEITVALIENHWGQMYDEVIPAPASRPDPGPIPSELLRVPGLISDVQDYTLLTAPYPENVLAFGGAISLLGLLSARKVRDKADNRTNLFLIALANSGAGKDHPRKVNQRILYEIGMTDALGDSFASGEGLEDRLFLNPAMLFQTDEIDGLMTQINRGKDARHEGMMNFLLRMYSSANSLHTLRAKAGVEPRTIDQPSLSVFGTAIPKHFYRSLSLKMLDNGFIARLLVMESGPRGRGQDARRIEIPGSIIEVARWWSEQNPGRDGNLRKWHPDPIEVPEHPEATALLDKYRELGDLQYSLSEQQEDGVAMAIWARIYEKARRLSLIYACSENHTSPLITPDSVRWSTAFVTHQTERMLFMCDDHVSENEFDSRCKLIVTTLRKWRDKQGDKWMPFWELNRRHPWSDREHEEIRLALLNQKLIEYEEKATGGPTQRLYRHP